MVLIALLGFTLSAQAQSAITCFGGNAANNTGSLSYSGGEVAVQYSIARAITVVNITRSFSEGVQQPFTPRDIQRYEGIDPLEVNMAVYPNPTTSHVVISCNQATEPLTYTLFNNNGQQVQQGTYTDGEERIDMENMPAGNYMLQVATPNKSQMNVYKIIKAK